MSDLWILFRYVYSKQHELSDRGYSVWDFLETEPFRLYILRESNLQNMQVWQVMELLKKDIRPRDIMTKEAFMNALTVDMALGCSTNSPCFIFRLSHMRSGVDFDIDIANDISEKTPNLCHLAPAGPTYMEDLNEAGGVSRSYE